MVVIMMLVVVVVVVAEWQARVPMEAKKGMAEEDGAAGAHERHMKPKNGKGAAMVVVLVQARETGK